MKKEYDRYIPAQPKDYITVDKFDLLVEAARTRQDEILRTKGADYTRKDPDRLANFKNNAKGIGITAMQVWAVYFMKHIDAIMTYVQTGKVESEAITGRLDDAHNYLYLLEAMIDEQDECEPNDPIGRCNMDGVCEKHREPK